MKATFLILVIAGLGFFLSCNKNSDAIEMKQVTSGSEVDTVIFSIDTLQYSLGSFGAKDELSVIKQPSHARLFELTDQSSTNKVLQYAPSNKYLGIDSVIVLTKRISEETADPVINIDSTLWIIRTVKNIAHKNLIGKWILVQRCGGFTGACDSVDRANATEIEFGYNMVYTERYKGSVVQELNYQIIDSVEIVPGFWRPRVQVNGVYSDVEFDFYFDYYEDELVEPGDLNYIYSRLEK
jgi:hypothetical protein